MTARGRRSPGRQGAGPATGAEGPPPGSARALPDGVLEFLRVLWALDHGLTRVSKQMLRALGVTGPQRVAVRLLGLRGELSARELADALHLDPSTITGILRRLADAGLVDRSVDPRDARRARLRLTAAGRKLDAVHDGTVEAEVRAALDGVPEADLLATRRVLTRIARRLASPAARPPRGRRGDQARSAR